MSTLTVLLAPDGPAAGVLDVLTDLSAAGLVERFLWVVDADVPLDPRIGEVPAVAVRGGRRTPTTVGSVLADTPSQRRRLCVVVPVGAPEPPVATEVEQRLLSLVSFSGGSADVTPIRVVIARPGDHAEQHALDRAGWHNVYLVPEDARGPAEPHELLGPSADPVEVGRYAAPALAGVVGLWTGVDATPLDEERAPSGVRAGRAFYRRIDAGTVEDELRRRVLATQPLPEPRDHLATARYVDDPGAAGRQVADRWWAEHRRSLVGDRRRPQWPAPLPTGAWALLKQFLAYLWTTVRDRPGEWVQGLKVRGAAGTARVVHDVVLGRDDTAYNVIVNGVDHRGLPAGWVELRRASAVLDHHLAAGGMGHRPARPDLRDAWRDYAFGALALADGGRHGSVEPARVGPYPGVLRSAADAVPPPGEAFTGIPGWLHTAVDAGEVRTGDLLGAETVRRRLQFLAAQNPAQADDAGATLQRLGDWEAAHRHTYSVQVGGILAGALMEVHHEIRQHLEWLRHMAAEEAARPTPGTSRFVVWLTRLLGVLAVAGLVAGPVLGLRGDVRPVPAVLITVVPLVVWLAFVATDFVRERREVFRDLLRRGEIDSETEARRYNLASATADAQRLADAYEQYLVWSQVLGAVINDPFGPPPDASGSATAIGHGLPRTTRVARADVDEQAVGAAASALRQDLYGTAWLGRLWLEHLRGAGREINRHDLTDERWEGITDLRGPVPESALAAWADKLGARGTSARSGRRQWDEAMGLLRGGRHATLTAGLLSSVRAVDDRDGGPVRMAEFLAGVHQDGERGRFDARHFSAQAAAGDRGRVDVHRPMPAELGLSRVDVLVQLSAACPAWDFAVTEEYAAPAEPDGPAVPAHPEVAGPDGASAAGPPTGTVGRDQETAVPQAPKGMM